LILCAAHGEYVSLQEKIREKQSCACQSLISVILQRATGAFTRVCDALWRSGNPCGGSVWTAGSSPVVTETERHCEEHLRRSNPGAACIKRWIASLRSQ
jgi:hypothetical protein